jgi:hypothetical protein
MNSSDTLIFVAAVAVLAAALTIVGLIFRFACRRRSKIAFERISVTLAGAALSLAFVGGWLLILGWAQFNRDEWLGRFLSSTLGVFSSGLVFCVAFIFIAGVIDASGVSLFHWQHGRKNEKDM